MFLNEIHEQLCSSELSKLFEGDGATLKPESLPKINAIIQAGILDLNKQFTFKESEILISTKLGKEVYELIPGNAVSSGNPFAFIQDSAEFPFIGDIQQIIKVTDSSGESLFMGTDVPVRHIKESIYGFKPSFYTNRSVGLLTYNTLKLDKNHDFGDLLVRYKARLKPLDFSKAPANIHIEMPDHFLNALVLYVASRKFNPMGSETIGRSMYHEGNNYWSKYLAECQDLKNNIASIASTGEFTNFERGGWA